MSDDPGIRRHIPNALTVARLVLAAVFFVVLARAHPSGVGGIDGALENDFELIVAALLFAVAAATDALDGYLARKWKVVSKFGRVMDPFADKILVLGAFVMLCGANFHAGWNDAGPSKPLTGVHPWMVVVVLGRELLVTSLRGLIEAQGRDFSATWSGKWKMVLQSVAVPLILLTVAFAPPYDDEPSRWFVDILVWVTVAVTVISGVPYVTRAMAPGGDVS